MYDMIFMIPHPDDEILACSYWLNIAVQRSSSVKLVYLTDGENDLIGELLAYCDCTLSKINDYYISAAVKLVPAEGIFSFFSAVLVRDLKLQPVPRAEIKAAIGDTVVSAATNELGYACFSTKSKIRSLTVQEYQLPDSIWRPVPASFHKEYGDIRFQESMHSLKLLGLHADIVRLCLKDGGLSSLKGEQKKDLDAFAERLLLGSPQACIIFPHEMDADSDHSTISHIIQAHAGREHTLLRYIVHSSINHKTWPNPSYHTCRNDRLADNNLLPPLPGEKPIEKIVDRKLKQRLTQCFESQLRSDEFGFLIAFAKDNEYYY